MESWPAGGQNATSAMWRDGRELQTERLALRPGRVAMDWSIDLAWVLRPFIGQILSIPFRRAFISQSSLFNSEFF